MLVPGKKYYLSGDIFPKPNATQHGASQVPYIYPESFNQDMNTIMEEGERGEDHLGVYYLIHPKKGTPMNDQVKPVEQVEVPVPFQDEVRPGNLGEVIFTQGPDEVGDEAELI